jgi:hypothetical protein
VLYLSFAPHMMLKMQASDVAIYGPLMMKVNMQVKFFLCLIMHHATKAGGIRSIAQHILHIP